MREFDLEKRKRRRAFAGRYIGVSVLLAAALAAGMSLPSSLMEWQDAQRVGRSELREAQEVVLTAQEDMSLTEKMRFIESQEVRQFPMTNGRRFTAENVGEHMKEELEKLKSLGILWDYDEDSLSVRAEAIFSIDTTDSERSVMIWDGVGISNTCSMGWAMDDESGKILYIHQSFRGTAASSSVSTTEVDGITRVVEKKDPVRERWARELLAAWAEYLECTLLETSEVGWGIDDQISAEDSQELQQLMDELVATGLSPSEARVAAQDKLGLEVVETDEYHLDGTLEDEGGQVFYQVELDPDGRGFFIFFSMG